MTETYTTPVHGNTRDDCLGQAAERLELVLGFNPLNDAEAAARGLEVEARVDVEAIVTWEGAVLCWRGEATVTVSSSARRSRGVE